MRVARDWQHIPEALKGAVVAIGNFDGLHRGHAAVIAEAFTRAKALKVPAMVMTFEPHPRRLFAPHLPPLKLMPLNTKLRELEVMGMDAVLAIRFTRKFSALSAEEFVRKVLEGGLAARHVVTGEDFVFGNNRIGDSFYLSQMAAECGFGYSRLQPVFYDGAPCSSTRIRSALAKGDIGQARAMLGHEYGLTGRVQEGDKRGRELGFPTANVELHHLFTPAFGVYAVCASIGGEKANGVANLGIRPTFGGTAPRLEAHLFDFNRDIYGQRIQVELLHFLRPEQKFDGLEALKKQISQDCAAARNYFSADRVK